MLKYLAAATCRLSKQESGYRLIDEQIYSSTVESILLRNWMNLAEKLVSHGRYGTINIIYAYIVRDGYKATMKYYTYIYNLLTVAISNHNDEAVLYMVQIIQQLANLTRLTTKHASGWHSHYNQVLNMARNMDPLANNLPIMHIPNSQLNINIPERYISLWHTLLTTANMHNYVIPSNVAQIALALHPAEFSSLQELIDDNVSTHPSDQDECYTILDPGCLLSSLIVGGNVEKFAEIYTRYTKLHNLIISAQDWMYWFNDVVTRTKYTDAVSCKYSAKTALLIFKELWTVFSAEYLQGTTENNCQVVNRLFIQNGTNLILINYYQHGPVDLIQHVINLYRQYNVRPYIDGYVCKYEETFTSEIIDTNILCENNNTNYWRKFLHKAGKYGNIKATHYLLENFPIPKLANTLPNFAAAGNVELFALVCHYRKQNAPHANQLSQRILHDCLIQAIINGHIEMIDYLRTEFNTILHPANLQTAYNNRAKLSKSTISTMFYLLEHMPEISMNNFVSRRSSHFLNLIRHLLLQYD